MKQQLEVSLLPSGWDASPLQGYPPPPRISPGYDTITQDTFAMGGGGGGGGGGREAPWR